ncbi:MAG: LPXTG cell wall anchor domain-containing protein [Acutalibacteraceae bacterium]|nr:LPXTG cell wall anchor domain-containing protein [Acutalibacteraceae bacterium]
MSKKKIIAMIISVVMVFSLIPTAVFAIQADEWVTGQGYGSITPNSDGTYTFQGDSELNTDNSHSGPYTKANAASLADGEIVESVDVFINPNTMNVAEKFALTVSMNDTNGAYKTELLANFWKNYNNAVQVSVGLDTSFTAELKETGVYTLKYRYFDKSGDVYAQFTIEYNGKVVASTQEINMNAKTADCGTRGYIWFSDISVEGGLRIGTPNVPSPAPTEQAAPILLPSDWISGNGYGSVETVSDVSAVLKGDTVLDQNNAHCGPYINTKGTLLENGTVVDEVNVYIDPAQLTAGEKFALTSSLNDVNDNYLTEFLVNFWKDNTNGVSVSAGLDPNFSAQITEAGLYTFKYSYIPGETMVFGNFSILKDGVEIASTNDILLPGTSLDVAKGRRAIWFVDISVANGLQVYSITDADYTKVDEAIAKANTLNRDEYKDFSGVDAAVNAVVRGKNIKQQAEVDAMAQAIEDAIATLEKKEETPVNPAEPTEPTTPGASGTIDGSTEQEMNSPQTGDNSNTVMWIAVAVLAAGAMTGTVFFARKKKAE